MNNQKPTHDYVARLKCGCIVALVADVPGFEKETAKSVAELIRDGCAVERVERTSQVIQSITAEGIGCHCQQIQQPVLF